MALAAIPPIGPPQSITQVTKQLTDDTLATVITAVAGKSINIFGVIMSSDTTCTLTLRAGGELLFPFNVSASGGVAMQWDSRPIFRGDAGESITIEARESSLNAAIYVQYTQEA